MQRRQSALGSRTQERYATATQVVMSDRYRLTSDDPAAVLLLLLHRPGADVFEFKMYAEAGSIALSIVSCSCELVACSVRMRSHTGTVQQVRL